MVWPITAEPRSRTPNPNLPLQRCAAPASADQRIVELLVEVGVRGAPVLENGATKRQWVPIASGFPYGNPVGEKNDKGQQGYHVFLVTNRHVFQGQPEVRLRFNPKESKPAKEYLVPLLDANGQQAWLDRKSTRLN